MAPQLCLILLYSEAENALGYWEIFSFWECNVDWHDITHDDDGTNILYSSTQKVKSKKFIYFSKTTSMKNEWSMFFCVFKVTGENCNVYTLFWFSWRILFTTYNNVEV